MRGPCPYCPYGWAATGCHRLAGRGWVAHTHIWLLRTSGPAHSNKKKTVPVIVRAVFHPFVAAPLRTLSSTPVEKF